MDQFYKTHFGILLLIRSKVDYLTYFWIDILDVITKTNWFASYYKVFAHVVTIILVNILSQFRHSISGMYFAKIFVSLYLTKEFPPRA